MKIGKLLMSLLGPFFFIFIKSSLFGISGILPDLIAEITLLSSAVFSLPFSVKDSMRLDETEEATILSICVSILFISG